MSNKERAIELLDYVPEDKMAYIIGYIQGLTTSEEIPNAETLEAMKELENDGGTVFDGSAHDFVSAMLED